MNIGIRIGLAAFLALAADTARAESSAAPAVESDYRPKKVEIQIGPGEIDQKDKRLDASAGVYRDSDGSQGASAQVTAQKEYLLYGEASDARSAGGTIVLGGTARVDGAKEGLNRLELQLPGLSLGTIRTSAGATEKGATATGRITFLRVGAEYSEDEALDSKRYGVEFVPVEADGHAAMRVGPLNLDFCGYVRIIDLTGGSAEILGTKSGAADRFKVGACAGAALGPVRLRDELSYTDAGLLGEDGNAGSETVANTLSLEGKVSEDFRIRAAWTLERETSEMNRGAGDKETKDSRANTRNLFTVGVAY